MAFSKFKVIELSSVTDQELETTINEWEGQGWNFDGIQFAMRESSKRPSMAFVLFTQNENKNEFEEDEDEDDLH